MANHAEPRMSEVSNLHRLQPLRVLLAGRDRRFMRVTSFLLSQQGYDVRDAAAANAVDAAQLHRADVVVLEDDTSRAASARAIAALGALAAAPSVVLVTDDHQRWTGLPTVPKWAPVESFVEEIEAASRSRPVPMVNDEVMQ
jgi:hypothetical protein